MVLEYSELSNIIHTHPLEKSKNKDNRQKTKSKTKSKKQVHKKEYENDVLCELMNTKNKLDDYKKIVETYINDHQEERPVKQVKKNDPRQYINMKEPRYENNSQIDTYNTEFNGIKGVSQCEQFGNVKALPSNEGLLQDLYNFDNQSASTSHTMPIYSNENTIDKVFNENSLGGFMDFECDKGNSYQKDLASEKNRFLHKNDDNKKIKQDDFSFFLRDGNDIEESEIDEEGVMDDNIETEQEISDNIFPMSEDEYSDIDEESDMGFESDYEELSEDKNRRDLDNNTSNHQASKSNDIFLIITYILSGIFLIFILEYVLYLGTHFIREI